MNSSTIHELQGSTMLSPEASEIGLNRGFGLRLGSSSSIIFTDSSISASLLYDYRFRESFRNIMYFLYRRGWLRMVSFEIGGKTEAVDMGALYQGIYAVFLGGADPEIPGIAKAMNMHHIEFAFNERISKVDFLCGDFHWKKLWHLDTEPLYRYVSRAAMPMETGTIEKTDTFHREDQYLLEPGKGIIHAA